MARACEFALRGGEGVLDGLAHRAAQLLFQFRAQAGDLLVQFGDQAHHQHPLDVGGERLVTCRACRAGGRRGRVLLDDLGEQRHFLDRAQRVFLLAPDQRSTRAMSWLASLPSSRAVAHAAGLREVVVADRVAAVAVERVARAPGAAARSSSLRDDFEQALVALEERRALGGKVEQHLAVGCGRRFVGGDQHRAFRRRAGRAPRSAA